MIQSTKLYSWIAPIRSWYFLLLWNDDATRYLNSLLSILRHLVHVSYYLYVASNAFLTDMHRWVVNVVYTWLFWTSYAYCLSSEVWFPWNETYVSVSVWANYCTSDPINFSANGRLRVGPNYVYHLYCSLPEKVIVWRYENKATALQKTSTPVSVTVARGALAILFAFEEESDGCTKTSAKITSISPNSSAEPFLELNCTDLWSDVTIPVTMEGKV